MYQDYLNCPWPLSVWSQGKLLPSFTIYNVRARSGYPYTVTSKNVPWIKKVSWGLL